MSDEKAVLVELTSRKAEAIIKCLRRAADKDKRTAILEDTIARVSGLVPRPSMKIYTDAENEKRAIADEIEAAMKDGES